jgi:hypothetical protein
MVLLHVSHARFADIVLTQQFCAITVPLTLTLSPNAFLATLKSQLHSYVEMRGWILRASSQEE